MYEALCWLNPPQNCELAILMHALQDRGVLFGAAMRYRAVGEQRWRAGETIQIDSSELVFLCDAPFEVNVDVEILLPTKVQVMRRESPLTLLCTGKVVRRVLANWPDLGSALAVSIEESRIACEADYLGSAAVCGEREATSDLQTR
jgi:hypothetical protein